MDLNCFYYTDDKKIFTNKIGALEYKQATGQSLYFYYYDHVYDKIDWSIEPPESLEFYYKHQAQRIRDEYDYVVLFYSGGYDSTNILETFHFNNIKLDKVVCVGAFKQDSFSGSDENHNGEIYNNCFPYLVELGLENITQICDYTDYFNDVKNFCVYEYGEQWIENVGPWYSPHNWFWKDIHKYVIPEEMEGKKVAMIWGKDKPEVSNVNNKIFFRFKDVASLSYGGEVKVDNIDRINFYWDPNYPLIPIKQAHVLMNSNMITRPNSVYNLRKPLLFKSKKSPSNLISLRDNFLRQKTDNTIFDFYKEGMKTLLNRIDPNEVKCIRSRFYVIKDGNKK